MAGPADAPNELDEESSRVSAAVSTAASAQAPLKVLHVYAGNLYGGIETFLRTLAEERHQCPEMEPEFALCFEGRLADEIRSSGAPLHMLGGVRLSRPWTALAAQRKLRKVIRSRRPDVVVCHAAWPYAIFGAAVKRAKVRLVFYQHDIGRRRAPMNMFAARVKPDLVIANSKFTAAHAYPKWSGVNVRVVYPAVQIPPTRLTTEERQTLRTQLGASDSDVVILQASRMQAWKGQALLVDALSLLPKDLNWKCWFAGNAQRDSEKAYVSELKESASKYGISDRIRFLGQRRDVFDLMQSADIFCQANLSPEPFGIVFVEALAAGLPVVTTEPAGGALEIVQAERGTISSPHASAIAHALCRLAQSRQSGKREATAHSTSLRDESRLSALDRVLREQPAAHDTRHFIARAPVG